MGDEGLNFVHFITKLNHKAIQKEKVRPRTDAYSLREEFQKYP